jgi:hypothetical protein
MAFYRLEMVNRDAADALAALLSTVDRLRPTPTFRIRAWQVFQRALDPLAQPRPLRRARF